MKKLFVLVLLIAAIGVPVYLTVTASEFGVGPEHPLGKFERIDAWLLAKGLDKKPMSRTTDDEDGDDNEVQGFDYVDTAKSREHNIRYSVRLVRDGAGGVRSIGTRFWSGDEDMGYPASKVENFTGRLWVEVAGAPAGFEDKRWGRGRLMLFGRIAKFDKGGASGIWQKRCASGNEKKTIFDTVVFRQ